jgi:hypothetical protein
MRRRFTLPAYIIFALIVIGLFASIIHSPSSYLIPILVFGIIILLYKFPPKSLNRSRSAKTSYSFQGKTRDKKKPSPFRVIQGNKDSTDDDTPKFH